MAALAGGDFIGTADINDLIPTERIQATVEGFNLPINIGNLIISDVAGRGYVPHQFTRWDDPTFPDPVRAGGETDTVLRMDMATSSSSITPVLKGVQLVIPDEPIESQHENVAATGIPLGALFNLTRKTMEFIDQDILDTAQAATNTVGTAVTVPSFAFWRQCMHAFKLLENEGQPIFVGNHYFWELMQDEFSTAISQFSAKITTPMMMSGQKSAFRGQLMGFDNWESAHVSEEGGGANNFMMTIGGGANRTVGYIRQRNIRVERSRGDEMQSRQSTQWTQTWADGVGLLRTDGLQECLADAAA